MTVVPFRRVRRPDRFPRPVEPPPALTRDSPSSSHLLTDAGGEDRRRMIENLAALAVVVVLLVLGAWMIERLRVYSRTLACIESGQRSCLQIDITRPPSR